MTKKEYINSLVELIINKVKYHAPNLNTAEIDYSLLEAVGIDTSFPIFIFEKELNKNFYKAFLLARKEVDFNLIIIGKVDKKYKKIKNLTRIFVYSKDEIGDNLYYSLDALNINYIAHCEYNLKIENEFIKVNNTKIDFDFLPYYYYKKTSQNNVDIDIKNFLLNGKNYLITLLNTSNNKEKLILEFNLPLPRGYYFFKNNKDNIEILNLTTRENAYLNFHFKNLKVAFSNINGLEYTTFACIHFKLDIEILPKQKRTLYFNYGNNKYCLYNQKDIEYFFKLSQEKCNKIFDIKVTTKDKQFDNMFNCYMPRKIWEKWQNFSFDEVLENSWIKLKNKIIIKSNHGEEINPVFKGLKRVDMYRNYSWKKVFIMHNNLQFLYADNVKYFNYKYLTKEIFKKNNEIYLSFDY